MHSFKLPITGVKLDEFIHTIYNIIYYFFFRGYYNSFSHLYLYFYVLFWEYIDLTFVSVINLYGFFLYEFVIK